MANPATLIISDTHLGRPRWSARSAEALRPLWHGVQHLVLNGDLAEVHHPAHWTRAAREVMRLFDLCEEDGVALTLLSGNHDPFITDLRHLHLADGRVFVTHGDALHPAVAPWSPAAAQMREAHEAALAALPPAARGTLEARLGAAQLAAHAEWEALAEQAKHSRMRGMLIRPWAIWRVLKYWRIWPRLARDFLESHAPEARYMVVGHTHRAGIWRFGERTIINTGSFGFPGRPWAVRVDEASIRVNPITWRGGSYQLEAASLLHEPFPPPSAVNTRPGSGFPSARSM
jgi:UDP-2,3-diacylglucosamine pyrophosphatase LpxH